MGAELKGPLPTPLSLLFSNFFQLLQRSPVRLGRREPDIPRREIVFPAVCCVSCSLIEKDRWNKAKLSQWGEPSLEKRDYSLFKNGGCVYTHLDIRAPSQKALLYVVTSFNDITKVDSGTHLYIFEVTGEP